MSELQKLIKYAAIAFGAFLCFGIISSILFGILTFSGIFFGISYIGENYSENAISQEYSYAEKQGEVQNLNIDLGISGLIIQVGEKLEIKTQDVPESFTSEINGNTLTIKEKNKITFLQGNEMRESKVILTIPTNMQFDQVKISLGVGRSKISHIVTEKLKINCGVGVVEMNSIISQDTKIKGGAGKTEILQSTLKDLDLETGVGSFTIKAKILGNSKIDCGVGTTDLILYGKKLDYTISSKTGLGKMTIEDEKIQEDRSYGDGDNRIKISGGIGKVEINFEETDRI